MKKCIFLCILLLSIFGCTRLQTVTQKEVVLLPEDRIYTVPAGQKITVLLDGKELKDMTFPTDMKLVHSSILVRQEIEQNDKVLKEVKAEREKGRFWSLITGITGLFSGILGVFLKNRISKQK